MIDLGFGLVAMLFAAKHAPFPVIHVAGCDGPDEAAGQPLEDNVCKTATQRASQGHVVPVTRPAHLEPALEHLFDVLGSEPMTADVLNVGLIPVEEESGHEEIVSGLCIQMQGGVRHRQERPTLRPVRGRQFGDRQRISQKRRNSTQSPNCAGPLDWGVAQNEVLGVLPWLILQ